MMQDAMMQDKLSVIRAHLSRMQAAPAYAPLQRAQAAEAALYAALDLLGEMVERLEAIETKAADHV